MSLTALLILAFAVVPAFALTAMGWIALAAEADDVRNRYGFEGMHFE